MRLAKIQKSVDEKCSAGYPFKNESPALKKYKAERLWQPESLSTAPPPLDDIRQLQRGITQVLVDPLKAYPDLSAIEQKINSGDIEGARKDLLPLIDRNAGDSRLWLLLGRTYEAEQSPSEFIPIPLYPIPSYQDSWRRR